MGSNFDRSKRQQLKTRGNIVIAFEGYETEPGYFIALRDSRMFPDSKLTPVPLKRDESKVEESNPVQVMAYLRKNQEWIESEDDYCPTDIFLTIYVRHVANEYPDLKEILNHKNKNKKEERYPNFGNTKRELREELDSHGLILPDDKVDINDSLNDLNTYMNNKYPGYAFDLHLFPNIFERPCNFGENHYVMVVDRDQVSFKPKDVNTVLKGCSERGYMLIVTSPCFELWVAMHFEKYSKDEMLEHVRDYVVKVYDWRMKLSDKEKRNFAL